MLIQVCAVSSTACYAYHVYQIGGAATREQGNQPSTEWNQKTLNAFAWGLVRQDLPISNCQTVKGHRFGIEEIKIETNAAYVLAATLTLGIWVPYKVRWRCARPPLPTDTLAEARP